MSAIADKGVKMTIKLKRSKANFGIGHIVNLLNGAEVLSTLLQICYAAALTIISLAYVVWILKHQPEK